MQIANSSPTVQYSGHVLSWWQAGWQPVADTYPCRAIYCPKESIICGLGKLSQ